VKQLLVAMGFIAVQSVPVFAGCLFGCAPPPPPPPTGGGGTTCAVKIVHADQVRSNWSTPLRFVAEVSGSGWNCTASAVQWSTAYYFNDTAAANSTVAQPYVEYNSQFPASYAVATLSQPWLGAFRSYSGEHQTVTVSLNGVTDTVKIVGDDTPVGTDFRHAATPVKNVATGRHDMLPFWYFLEQARRNPGAAQEFARFQYANEYDNHEVTWYGRGFNNLTDGITFDPYGAINNNDNYLSIVPPGVSAGDLTFASANDPALRRTPISTPVRPQGTQTCYDGACVQVGGVFLGFQDRGSVWSYIGTEESFGPAWQHAAIKRSNARFTEAPGIGFPVRTAPWDSVTGRYHRRQAYLDVNYFGGELAASWAERQDRKPYSLLLWDVAPQWNKKAQDATYAGFYCSMLVWAAWYHGAGVNFLLPYHTGRWGYILPSHLWEARTDRLTLRANMTDLP
jgi:uncharacterized protein YycO